MFYGWKIKTWPLNNEAACDMWIKKNNCKYEIRYIFVNNAFAVEYRPLLKF